MGVMDGISKSDSHGRAWLSARSQCRGRDRGPVLEWRKGRVEMETVRVGILGSGWFAHAHAQTLAALPAVQVTGIWSRTRAHAEVLAAALAPGAPRVYDGWEELIASGDVDAVVIATAPPVRRAPFAAAVERGLQVLVEKPLTIDLPEAQEMAQRAARADCVTAIDFLGRYTAACRAVKQALLEGRIGRVLDVQVGLYGVLDAAMVPPGWASWFARREAGGGLLRQLGTHDLDRVRFLTGEEFTCLSAVLTPWAGSLLPWDDRPEATGDGGYAVLAHLTGDSQVRLAYARQHRDYKEAVLAGESGTLLLTETVFGQHETALFFSSPAAPPVALTLPSAPEGGTLAGALAGLLADFIAAIRGGDVAHRSVPALPTIADGLRVQEAVAAIEQASRERREVLLPDARRAG